MGGRNVLYGVVAGSTLSLVGAVVSGAPATAERSEQSLKRAAWGQSTTRVSVSSKERQANHWTEFASVSANGRFVVFDGPPSNLVPEDTRHDYDLFLRDRRKGTTRLLSLGLRGAQANSDVRFGEISADGRFVTFASHASNLTTDPLERHETSHIFIRDRRLGTNELITVAVDGTPAVGGGALEPTVSAHGRYVAFEGLFPTLVRPRVARNTDHVFVRDRARQVTRLVSIGRHGRQGNGRSVSAAMSAGGRFVAFASKASNLVAKDRNDQWDVFVRNMRAGVTRRVSRGIDGQQSNGGSVGPALSPNGRYVAFLSRASNLVPRDTNGVSDVFVRNMRTGVTRRVSVGRRGVQANGPCVFGVSVSTGGRFVVFSSRATNLVAGDTNRNVDVFVRDRARGVTRRVSVGPGGRQANRGGLFYASTPDMAHVVFDSVSTNLVPHDTNRRADIFVRSR